ncbi:MAG: FAD-binding oxidoreductase [Dehalococcoidia bacterium]|jgi:NAD(P)H-flavin reductase|nr:FAD-binding oxidoreductase [Dehalococcoidia bacterium]MDW8009698.1 FAD-binding oxidoreductase [Chloroflexota bacterium]
MGDKMDVSGQTLVKRPPAVLTARIVGRRDLTGDLMLLWLEVPSSFNFRPGQYITIGRDGIERPYSIVSAPHELPRVELFIELVPQGKLTPRLWRLGPGDEVTMRPRAKGLFTFEPGYPNQLMVATVTGIAPFVSIIRDYLHRGERGHRFYVLQGASYCDEFGYDSELRELASRHPDLLTYVPTVSRPQEERNAGWQGETGRVNTIVEKYIETFGLRPEDTIVYACGHSGMIQDVKARLLPKGWRVKEEHFD